MSVERLSPARTKQMSIGEGERGTEGVTCSASCSFFASLSSIICLVFSIISSSLLNDDDPLAGRLTPRTNSAASTGGLDEDVDGGTSMFNERWWRMFRWWMPVSPRALDGEEDEEEEGERTNNSPEYCRRCCFVDSSFSCSTNSEGEQDDGGRRGMWPAHLAVPRADWPSSVVRVGEVSSSSSLLLRWSEEAWEGAILYTERDDHYLEKGEGREEDERFRCCTTAERGRAMP